MSRQCPDCLVDLLPVIGGDKANPMSYDTCESCGGVFLEDRFKDAADAKDAEKGIVEFFRGFSGKAKKKAAAGA